MRFNVSRTKNTKMNASWSSWVRGSRAVLQLLAIASLAAGCGSSRSPTAISDPYAGNWSGTIVDDITGVGALKFGLIAQPGGGVVGTWATTFPDAANNEGGNVAATVALMPVQFTLACTQTAPRGAAVVAMTLGGNRMSGTYSAVGCNGIRRGSMELTRQ